MLAISCILLSSKYNESEEHVPDLETLEEITQQSISNEIILNYELWILKKLGWKMNGKNFIITHLYYSYDFTYTGTSLNSVKISFLELPYDGMFITFFCLLLSFIA